jgi:hypothetical protein
MFKGVTLVHYFPARGFSLLIRALETAHDGQYIDDAFTLLQTMMMNEAGRKIAGGSLKRLSLWGLHGIATTLKVVYQYSISTMYKNIYF